MITYRHHLGGAALLTAAILQLGGCADDTRISGCQSDRDCRAGRVCSASGSCVDADDLDDVSLNNDPLENTNNTTNNDNNDNNGTSNNGTSNNTANNGPLPGCPPDTPPLCADDATAQVCVGGVFEFERCQPGATCEDGRCVTSDPTGEAFAVIAPSLFDYGLVPLDVAVVGLLTVRNGGDADLRVLSLDLESASSGFSVSDPISEAAGVTLAPGQTLTANVSFQPTQLGGYGNRVIVRTDAPNAAELVVALEGESFEPFDEPCLFSSPDVLDFGFASVGDSDERLITVGNCSSNATVTLDRIDLDDDGGAFGLTPFPTPFDLSAGGTAEVAVQFTPASSDDFEGQIVFQNSSTLSPRSRVELLGSSERCGETVVVAEDDSDVFGPDLPREVVVTRVGAQVRLDASSSTAPSGPAAFDWSVDEAPAGSTSQVDGVGGATFFAPDVPGEYVIEVEAYDANGQPGDCDTEEVVIYAVADEPALQATLSWDAAHDMDLHVLRARPDGSFPSLTSQGDLYYDAPRRDWGLEDDASDDGFHLGDDTDGFGPESAIVMQLEQGRAYQIVGILTRPASNARTFDASVAVSTTDPATGTAQATQTSRTFTLREVGSAWIAAEVAADGTITTF